LTIRPDDVWLAILTQFSFYVNANSEQLRRCFVEHEGKRKLTITTDRNRNTVDFGNLAKQFAVLIDQNVSDPTLEEWIAPSFSTTTDNDRVVCSVVMMATLKHYFDYHASLMCGIPRVTLEGTREDWADIYQRVDKLKEYGPQAIAWYHVLKPVLNRMVVAFDAPNSKKNIDFWSHVAKWNGGSGDRFLSGWITAFCFWDSEGKWLGFPFKKDFLEEKTATDDIASLNARDFEKKCLKVSAPQTLVGPLELYQLDGATFPAVPRVPAGYAEVDVHLDDNGEDLECSMLAGSVGIHVEGEKADRVSPASGWWIYTKKSEEQVQSQETQKVHKKHAPFKRSPFRRALESLSLGRWRCLFVGPLRKHG
jgi:hypothetical protein